MATPLDLHVWTDGTDTVIAASKDDAFAVFLEHIGERAEDYCNDFEQVPDDEWIRVYMIDSDPEEHISQSAARWAKEKGRSHLCSTEW